MDSQNSLDFNPFTILYGFAALAMAAVAIASIGLIFKEIMFPNWGQKTQFIIQKDRLPADEANRLLATANHPFQLFCRFIWGLICLGFLVAYGVHLVQGVRSASEAFWAFFEKFWAFYIPALVLTPLFIGLWLSLGPKAIDASHRLDRLFHRFDSLDSDGKPQMQGLVKGGSRNIRHFGLLWLLLGVLIAYHYFPHPGLPDFFDLIRPAPQAAD